MLVCVPKAPVFQDETCRDLGDEVLYGHRLTLLEEGGAETARIVTEEGYIGFVHASQMCPGAYFEGAFRAVVADACVLEMPDIKAPQFFCLPRFSRVLVLGEESSFWRVRLLDGRCGFVHKAHLCPPKHRLPTADEVCDTALSLLGTPYRWGGRSATGLDCSGLINLAFGAHGLILARDSCAMQSLAEVPSSAVRRGDLVLFSGHVGLMLTAKNFVHASAETGYAAIASLDPKHPLFDAAHTAGGYTFRRVL